MLNRVCFKFRKRVLLRFVSENLVKETHSLFPDSSFDPLRHVLYDKTRIEKRIEMSKFKAMTSSERASVISQRILDIQKSNDSKLGQKAVYLYAPDLPLFNDRIPLDMFPRSSIRLFKALPEDDKSVNGLNSGIIDLILKKNSCSFLPSSILDVKAMISHLLKYDKVIEDRGAIEMSENQVLVTNLPLDFKLEQFKEMLTDLHSGTFGNRPVPIDVTEDIVGRPVILKLTFKDFAQALEFHNNFSQSGRKGNMKSVTSSEMFVKNEDYRNRTLVVEGLDPEITAEEVLATCSEYSGVLGFNFPISVQPTKKYFTSEIKDQIESYLKTSSIDHLIKVIESDGKSEIEYEVYRPECFKEEEVKVDVYKKEKTIGKEMSLESIEKRSLVEMQNLVKTQQAEARTIRIQTIADSLKRSSHFKIDTSSVVKDLKQESKQTDPFDSESVARMIEFEKDQNDDSGYVLRNQGWFTVTCSSLHEARKLAYVLRNSAYLPKLKIGTLGKTRFYELFPRVSETVYQQIVIDEKKREEYLKNIKNASQQKIIEDNIKSTLLDPFTNFRVNENENAVIANGMVQDPEVVQKELSEKKEEFENNVREYFKTYSIMSQFQDQESLSSNLCGMNEVQEAVSRKGRKTESLDDDLNFLRQRINNTSQNIERDKKINRNDFVSGLVKVFHQTSLSKTDASKIIEKLVIEHGYSINISRDLQTSSMGSLEDKFNQTVNRTETPSQNDNPSKSKVSLNSSSLNRKSMFRNLESQINVTRMFSTLEKSNEVELEFQRLYKNLRNRYTGDYFKTKEFTDNVLENYVASSEK